MDLREAADALGVHYQTAYGWVRQGVLPARKVGRGYAVSDGDVAALAARRRLGQEPPRPIHVRDWAAQALGLYTAIAAGDEPAARHRLERLTGGVSLTALCDHVIAPALRQVGDDWAAGHISIAQEHRASAICERLIATHARQPAGRPHGTAIVATPPGERHGLPALMAAACLREDRWLVHHLASDLPVEEVTRLADQVGAGLIVLSSAMLRTARQAQQAAQAITAARPHLNVLVGRPGDRLHDLLALAANPRAASRNQALRTRAERKETSRGALPGRPCHHSSGCLDADALGLGLIGAAIVPSDPADPDPVQQVTRSARLGPADIGGLGSELARVPEGP